MGGSSVPSSTAQYQQLATGIWGSPQATKLALPVLKPALANIKNQQDMLMGFQKGDPVQTRKFFGLPTDASSEDIQRTIAYHTQGPQIQMPQVQTAQQPAKTAAHGGIMSLDDEAQPDPRRRYAAGGAPKTLTAQQRKAVMNINNIIAAGGTPTEAQIAQLNKIESNTGLNVSPYSDTGTGVPKNPTVAKAVSTAAGAYKVSPAGQEKTAIQAEAERQGLTAADAYLGKAGLFGTKITQDPVTKQDVFSVTNPYYNQAVNVLQGMNTQPAQFGQATQAYQDAIRGFTSSAGYTPQQVTAEQISAKKAETEDAIAAAMARGDVRDVAALRADVEKYNAALMTAPKEAQVKDYQAAQMNAAEMARARDVNAPTAQAYTYGASQMAAPSDVIAGDYTAAQARAAQMRPVRDVTGQTYSAADIAKTQREAAQQIGDIGAITGQGYQAATMAPTRRERAATTAAPKSWTDLGVASQYMDPYAQSVINQDVREANRNFQKNLSALRGQAAKSKAYGGSRQGLEESEALRNQGYLLADIQNKGLSQAYQQGMGQFQAEQGLGSQVGMSNTQAINALKSQYMQMGLSEAQANQAAINQAQQFTAAQGQSAQTQNVSNQLAMQQANAQMVNQLKSQYMSMGLTEAQADQAARNQAAQFGAQSAQQATLANQQAGLTTGQVNLSAAQQTALANLNAINQQRQTAVNNALQAAMTSYGGKLTAAQQNMIADNATKQFNAQNQTQISQANAQMNLTSQQSNQAADLTTNQANAQFSQQANAANQAAINQQRQNYVNNALQAAMQSYSGQLTAAQQNQIAQNAAAQFNAQAQNTANNNFAAQSLQANLANQQMDFGVGQLNTQNQQAANMYNAQAQNQANQQFATQDLAAQQANQAAALTAGQTNQQAGLQANQQAIGAYGQAAGAAQGLGSLGTQVGNYNANLANLWGQAGGTLQGLGQAAYNQQQANAGAVWGGPTTLASQGVGILGGMGGGQSGVAAGTQKAGG